MSEDLAGSASHEGLFIESVLQISLRGLKSCYSFVSHSLDELRDLNDVF